MSGDLVFLISGTALTIWNIALIRAGWRKAWHVSLTVVNAAVTVFYGVKVFG